MHLFAIIIICILAYLIIGAIISVLVAFFPSFYKETDEDSINAIIPLWPIFLLLIVIFAIGDWLVLLRKKIKQRKERKV